MHSFGPIAVGALLAFTLGGCASVGGSVATTSPVGPSTPSVSAAAPSGSAVQVTDAQLKAITDDLATRGVVGEVSAVSATAVTWNDGSLGCPQAGRMYPQVLTPGFQVVVSVSGKSYDYRFGGGGPRLCE
jgi:hypothetical protein